MSNRAYLCGCVLCLTVSRLTKELTLLLFDGGHKNMSQLLVHFQEVEIVPSFYEHTIYSAEHGEPGKSDFLATHILCGNGAVRGGEFIIAHKRLHIDMDLGESFAEVFVKSFEVADAVGGAQWIEAVNNDVAMHFFFNKSFIGIIPNLFIPMAQ
jgi:hypothetical protein